MVSYITNLQTIGNVSSVPPLQDIHCDVNGIGDGAAGHGKSDEAPGTLLKFIEEMENAGLGVCVRDA